MKKQIITLMFGLVLFVMSYLYVTKKQESCAKQDEIVEQNQPVKMRKFLLNKLWRDRAAGQLDKVNIHVQRLDDAAYKEQLNLKLIEEAQEVVAAIDNPEDLKSEIGDVLEVLECIALFHNISWQDILLKKQAKKDDRGSYVERQYVTVAECAPDSWLLSYYMKDPKRNVEIFD